LTRRLNGSAVSALRGLDLAPFKPRAPWFGADLQTLRNVLCGAAVALPGESEVVLPLGDGDALIGHYNAAGPPDQDDAAGPPNHDHTAGKPLVVLIHGLAGDSSSDYILTTARYLLGLGFPVLRLDLRGAGASQRVSTGRYHAGRSEDLAAALRALPASLAANGLLLAGYSLGGNMLLKFLGEGTDGIDVLGAVSVSAPFDLAISSRRIREARNWVYHRHLLRQVKAEALTPSAGLTAAERTAIENCRSIYEFDEIFVAPRHGFAGADDYHARCSARAYAGGIRVPTLVIHALDDPWIPRAAYDTVDWTALASTRLVLTPSGGHVGFHDAASPVPWHDRAIAQFAGLFG
jgi:predicted alpha/beta-fold hydrolase